MMKYVDGEKIHIFPNITRLEFLRQLVEARYLFLVQVEDQIEIWAVKDIQKAQMDLEAYYGHALGWNFKNLESKYIELF